MTFIPPTVPATVAPLVYALPVQFITPPVQFIAYHTHGHTATSISRAIWGNR
jgi:hypothetical protein